MRYILNSVFAFALAAAILGCASSGSAKFKPGTYRATIAGFGGDLTMEVAVDAAGQILSVTTVSHNDTKSLFDRAYNRISRAIVDGQTLAVDTVSGATHSSRGIIAATTAALEKSGIDMEALQNRNP